MRNSEFAVAALWHLDDYCGLSKTGDIVRNRASRGFIHNS